MIANEFADSVCNLECVNQPPKRHEFIGPVKIVLIETNPCDYRRKACGSALLALALLLMGAVVFSVFFFTLRFILKFPENLHIFLCTMGYQLFLPAGILMANNFFGAAIHLKAKDRKCQHILLQVFAITCGISGTVIAMLLGGAKKKFTTHAIAGLVTAILLCFTTFMGLMVSCSNPKLSTGRCTKGTHVFFGVPAFIAGTICFILGLLHDSFVQWAPIADFHYIIIGFTVIFTLAILIAMYLRHKVPDY